MELLNASFFQFLATAVVVCAALTFVTWAFPAIIGFRNDLSWEFALAVLAFSMLGFVTGSNMTNSREPAVAAVMPAALTLMGGVCAFLIGSKGVKNQVVVAALILDFSLALYIGGYFGAELRQGDQLSAERDVALEKNRYAVDLQRLLNYVELLKMKRDLEAEEKVDLSRYESILERKADDKEKGGDKAKEKGKEEKGKDKETK